MSAEEEYYTSVFSQTFGERMLALPNAVYARVNHTIDLLERFPGMGHVYEPAYEAADIPVECLQIHVPDTYCTLYYFVDEDARELCFLFLEDMRANPDTRFRDA